ncbi:hypothetical protein CPB84DRAFT_1828130 [Gymnopilus junonius]|uniref:Uncharacterized protein n=1 Tax=Gymnopilus junonius TaxID=109634 RepID=A0A9P5NFV0_GYMJU|nr:hypothetical protein CPB84DRAFT_1828130 [Gymnopilus junonius]
MSRICGRMRALVSCHWAEPGFGKCQEERYKIRSLGAKFKVRFGPRQRSPASAALVLHGHLPYHIDMLSIHYQAYRAVARWTSGKYVKPPSQWGDFSGDNWADSKTRDPAKRPADLPPFTAQGKKPTKEIEALVKKLNNQQWKKIIETALTFSSRGGKKGRRSREASEAAAKEAEKVAVESQESEFELEDDAMAVDEPAVAA